MRQKEDVKLAFLQSAFQNAPCMEYLPTYTIKFNPNVPGPSKVCRMVLRGVN